MIFRKNHEFSKISRFPDSGAQDGIDSWDPLGLGARPPRGWRAAPEVAESGPGHRQRLRGPQGARNNHTNPLGVPTGDAD